MSSKYASLPDIDSAPDVYETPDVPAEISHERDSDSDSELPRAGSPSTRRGAQPGAPTSENIDSQRLDTGDARRRFGEATLAAGLRDNTKPYTSRRLPSTNSYSTSARSGADGSPEKETTLERLRRLRSEVEELEQDVRREQAEEADGTTAPASAQDAKGKRKEVTPAVILQQLQLLRGDLGGVEANVGVLVGEGEKEAGVPPPTSIAQKAKTSSSLLSRLGLVTAPTSGTGPASPSKGASGTSANPGDGQLEKRVAEMERVLGASEADVDEASSLHPPPQISSAAPLADLPSPPLHFNQSHPLPPPLVQTLTRLDHLLTLLTQPRHLDSISRRVKVLVSDLERLHESRRKLGDTRPLNIALSGGMTVAVAGTGDAKPSSGAAAPSSSSAPKAMLGGGGGEAIPPDTLQKIDALFALLPRLDPLFPLTPRLLTRLRSLAALHSSAATFGETLEELKADVLKLDEGEKGLSEVVAGLERSVDENEGKVKGNLEGLEGRLGSLVKRMEQLGM
ncbi:hypothetical protein RQP46_009405 [Phenoliferia psychrophenolica]